MEGDILGKPHRKSLIKEIVERLDSLMALGESRGKAKDEARAAGEATWAFSTGKIHSYKTRQVYQEHAIRFGKWARDTFGIKQFADLVARADELASAYLRKNLAEQKSAFTLQTIRAALRMLFGNRHLGEEVALPKRLRKQISRSRGPKKHDREIQPTNWLALLRFLDATGLRRDEVKMLKVEDIREHDPAYGGQTTVTVRSGKGGKARTAVVDPDQVPAVLKLKAGRADNERVFPRIPRHLDVHAHRRDFAKARYLRHAPDHELPPPEKDRLSPNDYDRPAVQQVTEALGHHRRSVVLGHYLR
jgi:integrase